RRAGRVLVDFYYGSRSWLGRRGKRTLRAIRARAPSIRPTAAGSRDATEAGQPAADSIRELANDISRRRVTLPSQFAHAVTRRNHSCVSFFSAQTNGSTARAIGSNVNDLLAFA